MCVCVCNGQDARGEREDGTHAREEGMLANSFSGSGSALLAERERL